GRRPSRYRGSGQPAGLLRRRDDGYPAGACLPSHARSRVAAPRRPARQPAAGQPVRRNADRRKGGRHGNGGFMTTETVRINGLTLCHKHATGFVRSTLPDVCKAPSAPVPFVNIALARDLAKGTQTVKSHNGAMCGIKGSEFSVSYGDEPGVGGGVKSG